MILNRLYVIFIAVFVSANLCGQNWTLVWSEEFDGSEVDQQKWSYEIRKGFGNGELDYCTDRPQNIRTENGNLVITALKEEYYVRGTKVADYTSARINTKNKFDFTYGKIEARLKLPKGGGTWPAFWMLGYGSWPSCGELDIMEYVGNRPGWIYGTIHTKDYNGINGQQIGREEYVEGIEEGYHTFGMEWTDSKIKYFIDGKHYFSYMKQPTNLPNWPFDKPAYIILNLAIGGKMGGAVDNSIFPQQYMVDYVRVYKDETSILRPTDTRTPVSVSENPFGDKLNVSVSGQTGVKKELSLYDAVGRLCLKTAFDNDEQEIETSGLKSGIYILSVSTGSGKWSCKVIKQ